MLGNLGKACMFAAVLAFLFACGAANAQMEANLGPRPIITQNVEPGGLVALRGNTRPEARLENDRGPVVESLPMEHMLLQLRRSPGQERAFEQFIEELHTKGSPNYHRWISARILGQKYGPTAQELNTVTRWLESQGLKANVVYPSGMVIDFSGTAGQVERAFSTQIHNLEVKGEKHIANMSDPKIPAELAQTVVGVVSLHDFRPNPMHLMKKARPLFDDSQGNYAVVPADLATIYNLNPLFTGGTSGQGQTIVVIEDTDVFSTSDWDTFRSTFGLSGYSSGSFSTVYPPPPSGPTNCSDPGVLNPNEAEAILDAEWASAAAPSAAIEMATCADSTTTFGGLIALQNLINAVGQPPAIMSISYGQCEAVNGASANMAYFSAYQQAAAEGVSVFVAAGDSGAGGCDDNGQNGPPVTHGIAVNAFASTPYNVAVGGTDFGDTYQNENSTYWNSTNSPTYGSALSYIPEIPWNDSCGSVLIATAFGDTSTYGLNGFCNDGSNIGVSLQNTIGGGGGPSACAIGSPTTPSVVSGTCQGWTKPSWQMVVGNPSDGVRDIPDVSLFAGDGAWFHYYVFCWSDVANGGASCASSPDPPTSSWSGAGGTSFASPIMAGIQALVNQTVGTRQGNPNPNYYLLATSEYGPSGNSSCNSTNGNTVSSTCVFYDVTLGDMDLDCTFLDASDIFNCYDPDGTFSNGIVGVLSTSNSAYQPAYGATVGWDFATGIGTVNATYLVKYWPVPPLNLTGMWDLRLSNTSNPPTGQVGETEFTFDVDIVSSTDSTENLSNYGLLGDTFTNSACVASGTGDPVTMAANFVPSSTAAFQIGVDNGESYSMSGALSADGTTVTGTGVVYNSAGPNCGANDSGSGFTATLYKPATGTYVGPFTPDSSGTAFNATIVLNEDGNYNLTGTVTATGNSCFANLTINSGIAPSIASGDVVEFIGSDSLGNQVGFVGNAGGSTGAAGDTNWSMMFVTADVIGGACNGQTYTDAPFHKVSRKRVKRFPPQPIRPIRDASPPEER
jgi:subtilase family serine protease